LSSDSCWCRVLQAEFIHFFGSNLSSEKGPRSNIEFLELISE
jgi:hypothetical protein